MLKWLPNISRCYSSLQIHTMAAVSCQYTSAATLQFLDRSGSSPSIAYRRTEGTQSPGVMFLPGFMSNMNGGKAVALEAYCKEKGHPYVRFDYQGLGDSKGDIGDILSRRAFDVWKNDAEDVLNHLTTGPQIIVGSSMGAALMLLLAIENPSRVQALIGVATAVQFNSPLSYSDEKVHTSGGETAPDEYVTPRNFLSKKLQDSLSGNSLPITQPVRLIHGMLDDTIPYQSAVDLIPRLQTTDVEIILRKDGKHRMSEPHELTLLIQCLDNLILLGHGCSSNTISTSQL